MLQFRLTPRTSRAELREWHEQMDSDEGSDATLSMDDALRPLTAGQYSMWVQLVLTWGQNMTGRVLQVTPAAVARAQGKHALSDVELFALYLAERITVDGEDVTSEMKALGREQLAARNILATHYGDGSETSSILLAAQTLTNRTSPELHAEWEGEPSIEETARTLYHDLWPTRTAPVRGPLTELAEEAVPATNPTHITRTRYPSGHPAEFGDEFRNLAQRVPQVRGVALSLATKVRQQPKPIQDEVGEILFELVQNTEWHASDLAGGRTGANCRSFTFREYSYDPNEITAATTFDHNFVAYVRDAARLAERETGYNVTRAVFGTATIIDSGIGLARSVAESLNERHLLTKETEIRYLTAALAKNLKRRRVDLGDIGLARVQQSLTNLNGFMSVRTGTVEMLRNFIVRPFEPLKPGATPPPSLILDWIPAAEDFMVGPRVGTAVTIAYPVDFEVAP
ncbi:hypothetical protein [Microbacterium paraoxydans]|uniref:hypothetical protein n=1 Tax=Microbacterium paraoxydans TaxID=199592 RepID=UPI001CFC01A5|nr:hypothetical protein [Microbacterium paraoxydans]